MRIECIPGAGRPSIMTIVCDGEPWREVHTSVFGRRPHLPEGCQTIAAFQDQFIALEYRRAKHYALKRLSLQAMLSDKLSRALRERLVSEPTTGRVIQELAALGLLNDQEWVASFVRVQSARKVGPRAIAQKLAGKGVKGEKLTQALESSRDPSEQKISIRQLLKTRYSRRNLTDPRERQKVIASLVRRGFDIPVVLSCVGRDDDFDLI